MRLSKAAVVFLCAGMTAAAFQLAAPELIRQGRFEEALAAYVHGVEAAPNSVVANNGAGVVLDLMGRTTEARPYLEAAIRLSPTPAEKARADRAMAVSYGFSADCKGAEKYGKRAFEYFFSVPDYFNAGEVADEIGRLCLDAGDLNKASDWYEKGHDAGVQEPELSAARADLWAYRRAHARARIAARRGRAQEAHKLVAQARALLDKGKNPDQEAYFPYLSGYVSFYLGDYQGALVDFGKALDGSLGNDPFMFCMMGQTYEKLGDLGKARAFFVKAAGSTAHSVPAAYAIPFSKKRL